MNNEKSKDKERRKIIIINKMFQMKYSIRVFIASLLPSVFLLLLIYWWNINYLKQILTGLEIYDEGLQAIVLKEAMPNIFHLLLLIFISSLFLGIAVLFVTHKIAGPMFSLKKFMKMVEAGSYNLNLNFRKKDELKDIATSFNNMLSSILNKEKEEIKIIKDFEVRLNSLITESENSTISSKKCHDLKMDMEQFRKKKESYLQKRQI